MALYRPLTLAFTFLAFVLSVPLRSMRKLSQYFISLSVPGGRWISAGSVLSKKTDEAAPSMKSSKKWTRAIECPYKYILQVYGRSHFAKVVDLLDDTLKYRDPKLYNLILEIMDVVHFGAILVDDVADNSSLRKGQPAAHHLYGSPETVNRAYLRIMEITVKCSKLRPSLIPFILNNINEIHKGQDISLVWRRDGFEESLDKFEASKVYKHCAYLKTGALFRLVGQLVSESTVHDELMSKVGDRFTAALVAVQQPCVRQVCLDELKELEQAVSKFVAVWGRKEKMNVEARA
ncbi:hypothetical protein MMC25_008077 [Agyrium rufum]|nr:hypothetical protein [Agyrium rufum]